MPTQAELEEETFEEFGPEQTAAELGNDNDIRFLVVAEKMQYFGPVIMRWIERAYSAGYDATEETKAEGFQNFLKLNGK